MQNEAADTIETAYSREQPSDRYRELLAQYQQMHLNGGSGGITPDKMFSGISLAPQASRICALIRHTGSATMLDYGCGKGMLYRSNTAVKVGEQSYPSVKAFWGIGEVTLYDPAYPPYRALPQGKFDGVISTDVLEHCPQEDIPWIVEEIFSYASRFVFANIACYPAQKTLPNGENAHCTIQPAPWWKTLIERSASRFPEVQYQFVITEARKGNDGVIYKAESIIERVSRR